MSKNKQTKPAVQGTQDEEQLNDLAQNPPIPPDDRDPDNPTPPPAIAEDIEAKINKALETAQGQKRANLLTKLDLIKQAKNENQ
jgi:hypothetical protein